MKEKGGDGESSGVAPPSSGLVESVPLTSAVPEPLCCRILHTKTAMARIFASENFGGRPRLQDFLQDFLPRKNSSDKLNINLGVMLCFFILFILAEIYPLRQFFTLFLSYLLRSSFLPIFRTPPQITCKIHDAMAK